MTIQISTVANSQSFGTWLQRTNDIVYIISANAVTADSTTTGSITTGNAYVNGIFGSNTLYVTNIRAGNIWSNGALVTVQSNTLVNSYVTIGNSTVNTAYIGWVAGNNTIFDLYANNNTYVSLAFQNLSNGSSASADLILLNDAATSASGYLDIGINGSNYSDPAFTVLDPGGSYFISSNGVLAIGTDNAKHIKFFANGTLANNEVMRITPSLQVGIGTTTPSGKFQVVGNTFLTGNTSVSGILSVTDVYGNVTFANTISVLNLATLANVNVNVANVANVNSNNTIRVGTANSTSIGVLANNTTIFVGNTANNTIITGNTITTNTVQTHFLSVTGFIVGAFIANGSIIPAVNNAVILGTSSNVFNTAWATNVYSNAISSFSGSLNIVSNTTFTGIIDVNGNKQISTAVFNYTNNSIATVDSYSATAFRSAEYTVQATESATGSYHFTKLLVTHDGTTGYVTEYGTINNNGNLLTFACDINAGSVRLRGTPTSSNTSLSMVVKFTRDAITV